MRERAEARPESSGSTTWPEKRPCGCEYCVANNAAATRPTRLIAKERRRHDPTVGCGLGPLVRLHVVRHGRSRPACCARDAMSASTRGARVSNVAAVLPQASCRLGPRSKRLGEGRGWGAPARRERAHGVAPSHHSLR
eukprot:Amastigsp_a510845_29.p1 type:complete len:138 gc:universal Amastigsp_a510845_29:486-73(-)